MLQSQSDHLQKKVSFSPKDTHSVIKTLVEVLVPGFDVGIKISALGTKVTNSSRSVKGAQSSNDDPNLLKYL